MADRLEVFRQLCLACQLSLDDFLGEFVIPLGAGSDHRPLDNRLEGFVYLSFAEVHSEKDRVRKPVNSWIQGAQPLTEELGEHRVHPMDKVG